MQIKSILEQYEGMEAYSKDIFLSSLSACIGGINPFTESDGVFQCPHCRSQSIKRNGKYKSVQKYKCSTCAKEFRASTNTCMYYCKRPDRLPHYLSCIFNKMTIVRMAQSVNVSPGLAFQWRHKILEAFSAAHSPQMKYDATLAIEQFKYSTKGLDKRKNAKVPNLPQDAPVSASLLANDEGHLSVYTCNVGNVSPKILRQRLSDKLCDVWSLTTKSSLQVSRAVSALTSNHIKIKSDSDISLPLINGNEIKQWLATFNGVATKYLQHYFNWFVFSKCYESPRQLLQNIIDLHNKRLDIYTTYRDLRDKHAFTVISRPKQAPTL